MPAASVRLPSDTCGWSNRTRGCLSWHTVAIGENSHKRYTFPVKDGLNMLRVDRFNRELQQAKMDWRDTLVAADL